MHAHLYRVGLACALFFGVLLAGCSSSTSTVDVTTVLYPSQWMTNDFAGFDCPGTGGLGSDLTLPGREDAASADAKAAMVVAGWDDYNDSDCRINHVFRGAFRFELAGAASFVTSAILRFHASNTASSHTAFSYAPLSCTASLQIGNADWTTGAYDIPSHSFIPAVSFYPLPSGNLTGRSDDLTSPSGVAVKEVSEAASGLGTPAGVYFASNVTSQVNEWLGESASENHGFVLVSANEDLSTGRDQTCATQYEGISLEIHSQETLIFRSDTVDPTTRPTVPPTPTARPSPTPTVKAGGGAKMSLNPHSANAFCLNGQYPDVTVKNTGQAPLSWQAKDTQNITISPAQGNLAPGASQAVHFSGPPAQPASTITISFTSNGGDGTVTFTCT